MTAPTSIGAKLALHRLEPFLADISRWESDQRVIEKICLAPYMSTSFTTTGPAYDLAILLRDDPSFHLPGRSRARTETLVAEARAHVDRLLEISAEMDRDRFWSSVRHKALPIVFVLAATVAVAVFVVPMLR